MEIETKITHTPNAKSLRETRTRDITDKNTHTRTF